jgi:hypothetical protein
MDTNGHEETSVTRRGVMKGVGGLAALSMSNTTAAEAQEILESTLESDPHTVDTYRAIVDAILPRTPQLEDELGAVHVPGGLSVELEKFLIWDFNHFHEIRSETVAASGTTPGAGQTAQSRFEVDLDMRTTESALEAISGGNSVETLDVDLEAIDEHLDFGATDRYQVSFADLDSAEDGPASFDLSVTSDGETYHRVVQNYPYANAFPYAFDLAAADFLARGENEAQSSPNEQFPGGGTFVRLSRKDRLRCLWTIVDGGAIDRLDGLLSSFLPAVGLLKYVVMAVNGLHGFGYYTEWSGYGETKTADPSEREMQVDESEVQSRTQTDYPGPADGYAADWRHAVDGGFTDEWESDAGDGNAGNAGDGGEERRPAGLPDPVPDETGGDPL